MYVYYDVPLADCASTAVEVRAMQASLIDHAQRVALMRRPKSKAATQTWMEIYEDVADDFDARLAQAVSHQALVTGPRHVERFVPVD